MKTILTFLMFLFLFIFELYAQIAGASLFGETKSINPAVISHRPSSVMSAVVNGDKIKKEQDLGTSLFGEGTKSTSEIDIYSADLFYGGKEGGLITSEIIGNFGMGKKKDKVTSPYQTVKADNDVSLALGTYSLGLTKYFGLSAGLLNYNYKNKFTATFNDQEINQNFEANSLVQLYKYGLLIPLGLDFGFYGSRMIATSKTKDNGQSGKNTQYVTLLGGGIGYSAKGFHSEISYERDPKTRDYGDGKKYHPACTSFILEFTISFLTLGYTGRYLEDGYMQFDNILYNDLVYSNSFDKNRLEHTFNFSFGSSKGHSFSGSVRYSKIKNDEPGIMAPPEEKYQTTTTAMGASVKYAYVF